jgi:hypothetical protein
MVRRNGGENQVFKLHSCIHLVYRLRYSCCREARCGNKPEPAGLDDLRECPRGDPQHRVHQGLRDLSPCDDGTMTVVFEDNRTKAYHGRSGYKGRIFTATIRFTKNELDIQVKYLMTVEM